MRKEPANNPASLEEENEDATPVVSIIEAETSILAGIIQDPELFFDITEILDAEDFSSKPHRAVFEAMLKLEAAGNVIDVVTIEDQLLKDETHSLINGSKGLKALLVKRNGGENILEHAKLVRGKSMLRKLQRAGRDIAGAASAPDAIVGDTLSLAEQKIFELGQEKTTSSIVNMSQAIPAVMAELSQIRSGTLIGHPTGFGRLDRMTGGFQAGQLVIIAGRPSMGKSALAVQFAKTIAEQTQLVVPVLSYEMSTSELTMRLLSTQLEYDLLKLRQGHFPQEKGKDLQEAARKLGQLNILIDDTPPETIGGVRSMLRRLARRYKIGAVVVDYLQLMSGERTFRSENRTQEVSEISRGLKRLASDLQVPVLALSQLNRALEQRPNKRPTLADLRESGSLEQDANTVMFLYREHVYDPTAEPRAAELIVAKQRSGPIGTVHMHFNATYAQFSENPNPPPDVAPTVARTQSPFR